MGILMPVPMRLIMTILVKNEDDIIEENIRFHAAQGVDGFLVMDNNSNDNTIDILQKLASEFDITLVHEKGEYQQAKWMTALAKKARADLGADLVISNDADEFWGCADGASLKSKLTNKESIVTVPRYNYVLSREELSVEQEFWKTRNKVVSPILYSKNDQLARQGIAMPLVKISPKTIINPFGLLKIKGGNHRAQHLMFWRDRIETDIEVHHFPIRSYKQFEKNIKNRAMLLQKNVNTRMGDHYRRWVEQLEKGELPTEFARMSLAETDLAVLEKVGVIESANSHLLNFHVR
jgi:glycosyltransferase involved in cell wall biosynthesis